MKGSCKYQFIMYRSSQTHAVALIKSLILHQHHQRQKKEETWSQTLRKIQKTAMKHNIKINQIIFDEADQKNGSSSVLATVSDIMHSLKQMVSTTIVRLNNYPLYSILLTYNQRIMDNIDRVRNAFSKQGFTPSSSIRKQQLQKLLNSLMLKEKREPFDLQVFAQIWEQCSNKGTQATVQQVCSTFVQAQNIVQSRLLEITEELRYIKEQLAHESNNPNRSRGFTLEQAIDRLNEQRIDYQSDLRFLTQPFGINPISFMSRAVASRRKTELGEGGQRNLDQRGNEIQLKWLFMLSMLFGLMELMVIYKKYDFLNLMVFTCFMFVFLMNHFDRIYLKFLLIALISSEMLDAVWLFMNSSQYWSPSGFGTNSGSETGYLKLIVLLTYLGIFLKIPLGVFVYHYRNVQESRSYELDLGIVKFTLTPNKINPITQGINSVFNN